MTATVNPYTAGSLVELEVDLSDLQDQPTDASNLTWLVTDPIGVERDVSTDVTHVGQGIYRVDVAPTTTGLWRWRVLTSGGLTVAAEGTFAVQSIYLSRVTDLRDLRVLVPGTRRAIDGPMATAPDSPSTTLDDQMVLSLVADATADLILLTHGDAAFGYQLEVTARDPFYMAPVAWMTDRERLPVADAAIVMQAALNYYFEKLKLLKVSEGIKDEANEWTYELSASLLRDQLAYLMANRDKAIAALQQINAPMETYVSLVAERDRMAAAWLEPWVAEIGAPVPYQGGGGSGPLEYDYRFNTWG